MTEPKVAANQVVDSSVCRRCGMPIGYDRMVAPEAMRQDGLCSYCSAPERTKAYAPTGASPKILDLLISTYLQGRPVIRLAARLLGRAGGGPEVVQKLAAMLVALPRRQAQQEYDALVLYSGGKDSSTMLAGLARTKLRLCAWMLDQGYQSPAAIANARALCERLGVALKIERPERKRMDSLFRIGFGIDAEQDASVVRAVATYGSACWPCFSTIAARATAFCAAHHIPFCFIGTQPGQNRMDLEGRPGLSGIVPFTDQVVRRFVEPLRLHAQESDPAAAELLTLEPCATLLLPYFEFVPLPDRPAQLALLQSLGWKMPDNTGACSTNCMMNELGRHVMRRRFGFDLYQIIDAHERRMHGSRGMLPPAAPVDGKSVQAGARLLRLQDTEARELGLPPGSG